MSAALEPPSHVVAASGNFVDLLFDLLASLTYCGGALSAVDDYSKKYVQS